MTLQQNLFVNVIIYYRVEKMDKITISLIRNKFSVLIKDYLFLMI